MGRNERAGESHRRGHCLASKERRGKSIGKFAEAIRRSEAGLVKVISLVEMPGEALFCFDSAFEVFTDSASEHS